MEDENVGAGPGDGFYVIGWILNHQMRNEWPFGQLPKRGHNLGSQRKVRYEVSIHDVEVKGIDFRFLEARKLGAKLAEIGAHHRCRQIDDVARDTRSGVWV
jgi:hypothetical protein